MNYYAARQVDPAADRVDAGKYRFTVRNDDRVWATGACASADCDGHDTPEGACQHWVDGQVADGILWGECSWTSCDHRPCDEPARKVAHIGGDHGFFTLCGTHATDDIAADLFRSQHEGAFTIASSW